MFPYTPSGVKFKIFVKETNGAELPQNPKPKNKYLPVAPLTGEKAKEIYEEVVKDSTSIPPKVKPPVRQKSKSAPKTSKIFKNSDLLTMAQNNDVKNLRLFFAQNQNRDVNIVDDFGWTPLMCAACSGATDAVEILLENGADTQACDRLGNTALRLAQQKHRGEIIEILENYNKKTDVEEDIDCGVAVEPFYCDTCRENVKADRKQHESSTLHLFNSKFKTTTFYGIPESNKGFQLLLRKGWDKEHGLGRDGSGRKFPVKAVMKKDRKGIGAPSPTSARGVNEVHTVKYENKKKRTYKRWRDKDFEKNFRMEFS